MREVGILVRFKREAPAGNPLDGRLIGLPAVRDDSSADAHSKIARLTIKS
jgi:hypothetical protein